MKSFSRDKRVTNQTQNTYMQSKTIKKTLMCDLTDKERREYGISLATTLGDMEQVESDKKREMDHFKDRISGMQARADELSRKVRDGKEWREVECRVYYGTPDKEHKQTIRFDTGETVSTERMTEMDLQLVMPLEDETEEEKTEDRRQEEEDGDGDKDGDEDGDEEAVTEDTTRLTDEQKFLLAVENAAKKKRKVMLEHYLEKHGEEAFMKLQPVYAEANEPDAHLLSLLGTMSQEIDPTGDY